MAVKIGSARSSYGNTTSGDQNGGKEVSTENWYLHSKGWIVLRAIDPARREQIALAMERACDNNDIGYSQPTRNTLYDNVKSCGFDPARTSKKVNTDCSALVRVCVNFAGIKADNFITSSEVCVLMATGAFEQFTDDAHCKSSARLLRGDILVTRTKGHTVVVLSNGAKAQEETTPSAFKLGDRMLKNGSVGADVKQLQGQERPQGQPPPGASTAASGLQGGKDRPDSHKIHLALCPQYGGLRGADPQAPGVEGDHLL